MVVHASRFPECQLENRQQQRYERAQQNQDKLIAVLMAENEERMKRYLARFLKTRNWEQYQKDCDKQKEFIARRIFTVLG